MLLLPSLYLKFYVILMVQLCHKEMRNPVRYEDILSFILFFCIATLRPINGFFADISDLSLYKYPKLAEDTQSLNNMLLFIVGCQ